MTTRTRNIDMCKGLLINKIVIFALPIMAMNILQLMFNTADMVVAGLGQVGIFCYAPLKIRKLVVTESNGVLLEFYPDCLL